MTAQPDTKPTTGANSDSGRFWTSGAMDERSATPAQVDASSKELDSLSVSVLTGPRAMIVLGESMRGELCHALNKAEKAILADGIPAAVHAVIDYLVGGYSAVLEEMRAQSTRWPRRRSTTSR